MGNKKSIFIFMSLTALGLYGFFALFESFEEMKDVGWGLAARRNPYLAAEHFLRDEGLAVQSADHFEQLAQLPENGTLFISNSNHVLSAKRLEGLVQWIKNGGHLIVAAAPPSENDVDRLLAYFSIETQKAGEQNDSDMEDDPPTMPKKLSTQLREINEKIKEKALDQQGAEAAFEATVPEDARTQLAFEGMDETVTVHFSEGHSLFHPYLDWEGEETDFVGERPIYVEGDAQGIHFMQMYVEQGLLSVLSDATLWDSENIGHFDHAYLLRVLARDSNHFHILYGLNMPSLVALMRQHMPELMFSMLLWLMAWLRYRGQRFGPIRQTQVTVRRSMAEHVFASAAYLWRGDWKPQLLLPLQEEIEVRANRLLPTFSTLEKAAGHESLSLQSGLLPEQVEKAMSVPDSQTEDEFVEAVQYLQKMRSAL